MLRDPKHAALDKDELIKLAGISRATYYNAFKDENFIAALETAMQEYRSQNDFAVLHNLTAQAKTTKNHNLIMLYQRLQGRLKDTGEKPAQIVLVFGSGDIQRPKFDGPKVIEGEATTVEDKD